jgi:predicted transposase YdaD
MLFLYTQSVARKRKDLTLKPFDAAMKRLLENHPLDYLRFLGLPAETVELLDADVSSVSAAVDRVFRILTPVPYLVHIEFETGHKGHEMPGRLLRYNVLLSDKYELPVVSVLILLKRSADNRTALTGILEQEAPQGSIYLTFRYRVVRVWELDAEALLNGGLALLPLAPLAVPAEMPLTETVHRMAGRVRTETSPTEEQSFWDTTYILMGLRYDADTIDRAMEGVIRMRESSTYQKILSEGRQEGLAEGRQEGHEEGVLHGEQRAVLRVGRKRLGEPDAATVAAVQAVTELERLNLMLDRVTEVESWTELLTDTLGNQ